MGSLNVSLGLPSCACLRSKFCHACRRCRDFSSSCWRPCRLGSSDGDDECLTRSHHVACTRKRVRATEPHLAVSREVVLVVSRLQLVNQQFSRPSSHRNFFRAVKFSLCHVLLFFCR